MDYSSLQLVYQGKTFISAVGPAVQALSLSAVAWPWATCNLIGKGGGGGGGLRSEA